MPAGTRGKQMDVAIGARSLRVGLRGAGGAAAVPAALLEGELSGLVDVDECTWNLEVENGELTVSLEKAKEGWWKSVVSEPCSILVIVRFALQRESGGR